jgi:hypothetical protein
VALNKFISLLDSVTSRPGMYLVNNVEDLNLLIFGYLAASDEDESSSLMSEFRKFVNHEFKTDSDYDWPRLIRFHSDGGRSSIELFKVLFSRYIAVHQQ